MLTLEQIKAELAKSEISYVARAVGCSKPTLYNIMAGKNDNPRIKTVEALSDYFTSKG